MNNIIQNLKLNSDHLSIVHSVLLRKIGSSSNASSSTHSGITVKHIVPSVTGSVNLIAITSTTPPELYIVYYDNMDMNKATSECVVQINFTNNHINLTETVNGQALVREYTTSKSKSCQNIIKFITRGQSSILYNLSAGQNTYPVHSNSIIDKLNSILQKLSVLPPKPSSSSTTQNLVNIATVIANDPATHALANSATNSAVQALSKSPRGKMALGAFDILKQVASNPIAQELASTALTVASDKMAKSPRGQKALKVANVANTVLSPIVTNTNIDTNQSGGSYYNLNSNYVNLAKIYI